MDKMREAEFCHNIRTQLALHPEWLSGSLMAVTAGMLDAIQTANERAGKLDVALRSALALSNAARITDDVKQMLSRSILDALPPKGLGSKVEEQTRERLSD